MAKRGPKPKPKGETDDGRHSVISIKGTVAFRDWLNRAADHERLTTVQFLERAAIHYAKHVGFGDEPPRRTGERTD